jgi:hypothetical protein
MKIAWVSLLALGCIASAVTMSACEVTTSNGGIGGEDDEGGRNTGGRSTGGATGGRAATGGASTGGTTGGASPTGGATATGGAATGGTATGGDSSFAPVCDDDTTKTGTAADTCEINTDGIPKANADCISCLSKNADCCTALKDCYSTDPNNQCGYGGSAPGETEYLCYQDCLVAKVKANGIYEEDDQVACADSCTGSCGVIGDATNAVIACMHDNCEAECFE